jgi:uncharacterized protein YlxP (DUF503 family)
MIVAVALVELHIEYAQSLKDKRQVVRSLRDRLRRRFNVSANEVALQDLHQRARIGITAVAHHRDAAGGLLESIQSFIESNTDAVIAGWTSELLEFDATVSLP